MSMSVFAPENVSISIGGFDVTGWISATMTRNTENTGKSVSADGKVALTVSADKTATFDIEVQQQNTAFNAFATAIQGAQDATADLLFFDIVVSDKSGGFLTYLNKCHLDVPASQELTQEGGNRTWAFYVQEAEYVADISGFGDLTAIANAEAAVQNILGNVLNKI